jgi:hypothetical protein
MLGLASFAPIEYSALVQEDRFIEWWTVTLFLAAAIALVFRAVARRSLFELLAAAFCIFVAGEEFSWGQRLLGFTPPTIFVQNSTQQEFTLHNFASLFGRAQGMLIVLLFAYGVVFPMFARLRPGALFERAGVTPPPLSLAPWYLIAVGLLYWYPVDFTGEWVEAMAGGLFFVSTRPRSDRLLGWVLAAACGAFALTFASTRAAAANPATIACAHREALALITDLKETAATPKLLIGSAAVHERVWTAIQDDFVHGDQLFNYALSACAPVPRYIIDPWGTAYWLRFSQSADSVRSVSIYSMGPNRRLDHSPESQSRGDDVVVTGVLGK